MSFINKISVWLSQPFCIALEQAYNYFDVSSFFIFTLSFFIHLMLHFYDNCTMWLSSDQQNLFVFNIHSFSAGKVIKHFFKLHHGHLIRYASSALEISSFEFLCLCSDFYAVINPADAMCPSVCPILLKWAPAEITKPHTVSLTPNC